MKGFNITHPFERVLATHILKMTEVISSASENLEIHRISDYVYELATKIGEGYR